MGEIDVDNGVQIRRDLFGRYTCDTKYFEEDYNVKNYYNDINQDDLEKFRRINFNNRKL